MRRLALLYPTLDEPTLVAHRGRVVGVFHPKTDPAAEVWNGGIVKPYIPDRPDIEGAKVAMEAAEALAEIQLLRDELLPAGSNHARGIKRDREAVRRRLRWATLRRAAEKETHDHDD